MITNNCLVGGSEGVINKPFKTIQISFASIVSLIFQPWSTQNIHSTEIYLSLAVCCFSFTKKSKTNKIGETIFKFSLQKGRTVKIKLKWKPLRSLRNLSP